MTSNYGYDAIYELTSVLQGANTTESYTYDPVGNRLSSLGVSPYSYNASNRLTSTPNATYGYDLDGNAVTKNRLDGDHHLRLGLRESPVSVTFRPVAEPSASSTIRLGDGFKRFIGRYGELRL